jgi:hypothetical protein
LQLAYVQLLAIAAISRRSAALASPGREIKSNCYAVCSISLLGAAFLTVASGAGTAETSNIDALARCRSIVDQTAQLRCYQDMTSRELQRPDSGTAGPGTWRLVRTPNPRGGPDVVSITQTADPARSDIDLAGLMVRCGTAGSELRIVLVQPLPPRARPKVNLTAGGTAAQFDATVIPPGTSLSLPPDTNTLVDGLWQSSPELSVEVDEPNNPIRGVIPLAGLAPALGVLR